MKEKQKKLQERYMEMQVLEGKIQQIQKHLQNIDSKLMEVEVTQQSLEDLKKIELGTEILIPLSPGIFVKAELKDSKEVTVNVGAEIAITKSVDDTKKLMQKQLDEINVYRDELLGQLQQLSMQAKLAEDDMIKITEELEK